MNSFTHPEMTPFMHHDYQVTYNGFDDADKKPEGYEPLELVLLAALAQASTGKGKERHANDQPFGQQRILAIGRMLRSADGEAYQAIKKTTEALDMHKRGESDAAIREVLGAINYLAAVAILIAEDRQKRINTEMDLFDFADSKPEPESSPTLKGMVRRAVTSSEKAMSAVYDLTIGGDIFAGKPVEAVEPQVESVKCPKPGGLPTQRQYRFALENFHDPVLTGEHLEQIIYSISDMEGDFAELDAQDERNIATAEGCILKWQRQEYPDLVAPPAVEEPAPIEIADETPMISKGDDQPREPEVVCPPYDESPNAEEYGKALTMFHPASISDAEIAEFVKETLAHDTRISKGYPTGKLSGRVKATLNAMREWRKEYYGPAI